MEDRNRNPFHHLMRMIRGGDHHQRPAAHHPTNSFSPFASTSPIASTKPSSSPANKQGGSSGGLKGSRAQGLKGSRAQGGSSGGLKRAEVGAATWTFLHTLAAQLPDHPSKQQQKDVKTLIDLLTRIYPCGECAEHWHELVKGSPPDVATGEGFRQWLCSAHNKVNRNLGKPEFNCSFVASRWSPLNCKNDEEEDDDEGAVKGCDLRQMGRK